MVLVHCKTAEGDLDGNVPVNSLPQKRQIGLIISRIFEDPQLKLSGKSLPTLGWWLRNRVRHRHIMERSGRMLCCD